MLFTAAAAIDMYQQMTGQRQQEQQAVSFSVGNGLQTADCSICNRASGSGFGASQFPA
jgi:hypothetical protein